MNRILIVDDDVYIRELVSTILKQEGFLTIEAVDGNDALQKVAGQMNVQTSEGAGSISILLPLELMDVKQYNVLYKVAIKE